MGTNRQDEPTYNLRVRVKEFAIPPVRDALVVGRDAPIGSVALRSALRLLAPSPFDTVALEDDVVGDLLVRSAVLRRVPAERLVAFVLARVKPLMTATEILHLDIDAEVVLHADV